MGGDREEGPSEVRRARDGVSRYRVIPGVIFRTSVVEREPFRRLAVSEFFDRGPRGKKLLSEARPHQVPAIRQNVNPVMDSRPPPSRALRIDKAKRYAYHKIENNYVLDYLPARQLMADAPIYMRQSILLSYNIANICFSAFLLFFTTIFLRVFRSLQSHKSVFVGQIFEKRNTCFAFSAKTNKGNLLPQPFANNQVQDCSNTRHGDFFP